MAHVHTFHTYTPTCIVQVKLEKLEADLESENPWERVINLVDMQAEAGKADMSRIKQIFIQLKNEPIKADA